MDERRPAERRLPRHIRLLIAARAVNQLGAFSLAFLTVLLHHDLGASLTTAGFVSAAFGAATVPSRLLGGRLSEHYGPRRTIVTGLVGCAAGQLGIVAAPDLPVAACCAVLLGLAFELYEPASQAMIAECVAPADRAPAYALLTTALAVGNTGAGLIAGLVGRTSLRPLFLFDAASCLACAAFVRLALPRDCVRPRGVTGTAHAAGISPWRDRALLLMTAAGTVYALVYMVLLVSLPLSLNSRGLRPSDAGLLMAAGTLTLVPARSLSRRRPLTSLSPTGAFVLGYALMAVGLFGYALGHTLPALLGPTALLSIGNLLLMGRAFAVVSELAPPGAAARYLAVYGSSWGFATVLAPMLGTWLLGAFGSSALWGATAGVCAAMAVAQPWALRRHPAVPAQRKRGRRSSAPLVTSGPARPSSLGRAREGRIKA